MTTNALNGVWSDIYIWYYELMNIAKYGKTLQNLRNRVDMWLVNNKMYLSI